MEYTHLVSVAALVTNNRGEILLVNSPWRGWEYPGGLIEPGETFEEALKREVREEAGIEIEITSFIGICKNIDKNIVNIDFTAKYISGELTASEESTEVMWVDADKAINMIMCPLTKKRLANMLASEKFVTLFSFRREKGFEVVSDSQYTVGN